MQAVAERFLRMLPEASVGGRVWRVFDQAWLDILAPTILVAVFVVLLVSTGAIVLDAKRAEIVTAAAWRVGSIALALSAVVTAALYGEPIPIGLCALSLIPAMGALRSSPVRPRKSVPRYSGSRAKPPTDAWATRRNVLIYASFAMQCLALGAHLTLSR